MRKVLAASLLFLLATTPSFAAPVAAQVSICDTAEEAENYARAVLIYKTPAVQALEQSDGSCSIEMVMFEPGEVVKSINWGGFTIEVVEAHAIARMDGNVMQPAGGTFYVSRYFKAKQTSV